MAFDAGTIIAYLDLDDKDFDRKLREDVRKIEEFERGEHEIKFKPKVDPQSEQEVRRSFERMDRTVTNDARRRRGVFGGLFGGIAGAAGPGLNTGLLSRLVTTRTALYTAGGAVGLGALPALAAPLLGGGIGVAGAGVAALGARMLIGSKQQPGQLYQPAQDLMKNLKDQITKDAGPLVEPLRKAFGEIPRMLRSLGPDLRAMFAGAATLIEPVLHGLFDLAHNVLPLLGQAFRAAAPLMRPLIDGVGQLLSGVLRGVIPLLRAAQPAIAAFGRVLRVLGSGLGGMLKEFAPAIKASSVILKALGDVLGAIFPVVGKLAGAFARSLAPVFVQFAQVIEKLIPFLRPIGDILAKLAGAVLKDLVSLLGALATLLVKIAPSFDILAKALVQTFTILENSGVFGVLASALERIVPVLAKFINDLVRRLAPYLPVLIQAFADWLSIMVQLTAAGLTGVISALDWMVRNIPGLIPIILLTIGAWKGYQLVTGWINGVKKAIALLTAEETINKVKSVADIAVKVAKVIWSTAVMVVQYAIQAAAATAAFIAENAATLGIIAGIALLIGAIIFLATHWKRVWHDVVAWAKDAWEFLTHGWGQWLIPGLYLIRKVVEFVRDHWKQAWDTIKGVGLAAWHFIHDNIVSPIADFFTKKIPGYFDTCVSAVGKAWKVIQETVRKPVAWVVDNVVNGLINAFNWVSDRVHGPHIKSPVHPFGLQKGGRLPGWGGGDILPALLEPGETVVSKEHSAQLADVFNAIGVPGYQHGGAVQPGTGGRGQQAIHQGQKLAQGQDNIFSTIWHKGGDIAKAVLAIATGNQTALRNALMDLFPHGVGGAGASLATLLATMPAQLLTAAIKTLLSFGGSGLGGKGAEIAKWAMSWAGRIPYVWGGTAVPGGADCSGFTGAVYRHFGILAPRTSEAQGAWVTRGAPQIGGLAFYNSPAGGPPPGHVAIVGFNGNVISQGGGMGPQIQPLRSMPFMFAGVPPGGKGSPGRGGWNLGSLEGLWQRAGGPASQAHVAAAIALAESSGNPQARNPSGASGLWQILGQVFPGNIFDPYINARNAVRKYYQAGGFSPWVTYEDGAYRQFMDNGGWLPPGGSFVLNATRRGEAVLNPGQSRAFIALGEAAEAFARSGGSAGPAGLMRDIHLTLPEGSTVAEALREVSWLLRTQAQQGYTGVR